MTLRGAGGIKLPTSETWLPTSNDICYQYTTYTTFLTNSSCFQLKSTLEVL